MGREKESLAYLWPFVWVEQPVEGIKARSRSGLFMLILYVFIYCCFVSVCGIRELYIYRHTNSVVTLFRTLEQSNAIHYNCSDTYVNEKDKKHLLIQCSPEQHQLEIMPSVINI